MAVYLKPFDAIRLKDFCDDKNIWLIEDNCDALGSKIGKDFTGTIAIFQP